MWQTKRAFKVRLHFVHHVSLRMFLETVDKAVATFGSLSGAVNCAGIAIASKVISKKGVHTLDSFMKVLSINLGGSFNVARLVAAQLANQQVG
jgi:NAD(P)-dependent dehydrogenase (short-subunit alcohol dehydrogenase family)